MPKIHFREGKFADFSVIIDGKRHVHNGIILSFRSEFIESKLRVNPESQVILNSCELNVNYDFLVNAFDSFYDDIFEINGKSMNILLQYRKIFDFLIAPYYVDQCNKEIALLIINIVTNYSYGKRVEEILNTDDYSKDMLIDIFNDEKLKLFLVNEICDHICNKPYCIDNIKVIDFIEIFKLQNYINAKTLIKLSYFAEKNGIYKDWLITWKNMILEYDSLSTYNGDINYKIIGKKNNIGEIMPLNSIEKEYLNQFNYGIKINIKI